MNSQKFGIKRARIEGLPRITQACLILLHARRKACDLLKEIGPLGTLPSTLITEMTRKLVLQIHHRITPVMDDINNEDFMNDLNDCKNEHEMSRDASVFYIGSGNDISVQRVFPQAINVDIRQPQEIPENYRFIQGDVRHLPHIESGTVDLAVFRYFDYGRLELPAVAQELERILKVNGKILSMGNHIDGTNFSKEPDSIKEAVKRNIGLRILSNLCRVGIGTSKQYPNGTTLLKKGQADSSDEFKFDAIYTRNRGRFYKLLAKANVDYLLAYKLMAIRQHEYILGLKESNHIEQECIVKTLESLKDKLEPADYAEIEKKLQPLISS